ncbi:MAG: thiosulfate sulfurtransferase [endosymbiont of Galathealinum brachiosum]|uniref:Sulfurtransferase n=1 Tax=endosymbiont of Galathealinum brachiosum TaxID=2200906 RepID=A0A370DIR2_9GAMM|nr:MAG: thiosulfate sulfurtransferase [endosymbiont of Galathealinum brachiosum]
MTNTPPLPLVIEPEALNAILNNENLLIVDLSSPKQYQQAHIPEAVFLDYGHIVGMNQPYTGLLPEAKQFEHIINSLGITPNTQIVAYDEEGGGKAARLIWTLHAMNHNNASMLNGGLIAWYREKHPLSNKSVTSQPNPGDKHYKVDFNLQPVVASTEYIIDNLENNAVGLLDARSIDEFTGNAKYAQKTGRIPGAKHFEWTRAMDTEANYRLLSKETLQPMLDELGLTQDKEIIVYCQSHHRSALSYLMLKYLGYEKVRGYPGSWSEWGNRTDTPIEN